MQRIFTFIILLMATTTLTAKSPGAYPPEVQLNDFLQENWTQQETDNAKLVIDFVQQLMNEHNFEYILKEFGSHPYLQHNRNMTDGIDGVLNAVRDVVKRYPEYAYDVKRIVVSGDLVIFHSHVTVKAKQRGDESKGFIISDTWRIQDGQIVEHWDAIQALNGFFRFYTWLTGGKVRNANGLF